MEDQGIKMAKHQKSNHQHLHLNTIEPLTSGSSFVPKSYPQYYQSLHHNRYLIHHKFHQQKEKEMR